MEKSVTPVSFEQLASETDTGTGVISGYASRFHLLDSEGDIVLPGAFRRTLEHQRRSPRPYLYPLLYQHDPARVIGGIFEAYEDREGLFFRAHCHLEGQDGRECFSLARAGMLFQCSIGYDVPSNGADYRQGHRYLREIRLWEISLVTFAANPGATLTEVQHQASQPEQLRGRLRQLIQNCFPAQTLHKKGIDLCTKN